MSHRYELAPDFRDGYVPCCCDDDHEGDVQLHDAKVVYQDTFGVPFTYICAECADARVKREQGRFA